MPLPVQRLLLPVMQDLALSDVERTRGEESQDVLEPGHGETQFMTVASGDAAAAQKRALWTFLPSYSMEAAVQVERGGKGRPYVSTHSNTQTQTHPDNFQNFKTFLIYRIV